MIRNLFFVVLAGIFAALITGCSGATDVSHQPSQDEIQKGIERRLAEIDKIPNLSPEQRERMKQQIQGSGQSKGTRPQGG